MMDPVHFGFYFNGDGTWDAISWFFLFTGYKLKHLAFHIVLLYSLSGPM